MRDVRDVMTVLKLRMRCNIHITAINTNKRCNNVAKFHELHRRFTRQTILARSVAILK